MMSLFLAFPPYLFTLTALLETEVTVNPASSALTAKHLKVHPISSSPVCTF